MKKLLKILRILNRKENVMINFYGKESNYYFGYLAENDDYDVTIYSSKEEANNQYFYPINDSEHWNSIDACIGWAAYYLINNANKSWHCIKIRNPNMELEKEYYTKDTLIEDLWRTFIDVNIDENECIEQNWFIFEKGTYREEIWHWFDENHSKGVGWLINDFEE